MSSYRQRIEARGLWQEYTRHRQAGRVPELAAILRRCGFTALEIESITWAKGELGPEPAELSKRENLIGLVCGSFALAIICGCLGAYYGGGFGGLFSTNARESNRAMNRVMNDYRTPKEALKYPFLLGAAFGACVPWIAAAALKRKEAENA
jgi:hypothetical protein